MDGLIQFNSEADHICDPNNRIDIIKEKINMLASGGETDMAQGLRLAYEKIKELKGNKKVIVLVTDGEPSSEQLAIEEAQNIKENKIDIITIGTEDANNELLKKIASCLDLSMVVADDALGESIELSAEKLPELSAGDAESDLFKS
jgi:Mg-chelatase subunit ChlD